MSKTSRAATVKDVSAADFVKEYAAHLRRNQWLKLPEYVDYVKLSTKNQLPPQNVDWYYVRAGKRFHF